MRACRRRRVCRGRRHLGHSSGSLESQRHGPSRARLASDAEKKEHICDTRGALLAGARAVSLRLPLHSIAAYIHQSGASGRTRASLRIDVLCIKSVPGASPHGRGQNGPSQLRLPKAWASPARAGPVAERGAEPSGAEPQSLFLCRARLPLLPLWASAQRQLRLKERGGAIT